MSKTVSTSRTRRLISGMAGCPAVVHHDKDGLHLLSAGPDDHSNSLHSDASILASSGVDAWDVTLS